MARDHPNALGRDCTPALYLLFASSTVLNVFVLLCAGEGLVWSMLGAAPVGRVVCLGNVAWEMHRRHCVEVVEERDFHRSLVVACDMAEGIEGLSNNMI